MAAKKYNWVAIKTDYIATKYKTLKELAEAHEVNYGYMKKKAAEWKKDKEIVEEISFMQEQERVSITYDLNSIPDDKDMWHKRLWDKLGLAAERALDNPELNFYTEEGTLKSKALADVAAVIDKVQKGHAEIKDDKVTGQLHEYAKLIANYRQTVNNQENNQEDEEDTI